MRGPALRSAISAIMVPNMVVVAAVIKPKNNVFHATPQRWPPAKQFKPQMRSLPMRSKIAVIDHLPSSVKNAPYSALETGKAMNKSNNTAQPNTADAMNKSPLKKPRRAMPNAMIITKASNATNAPMPIPNWFNASSPNCVLNASNCQPFAPIKNPLTNRPKKPIPPPAMNQLPCVLPAGTAKPIAAMIRPTKPMSNHFLP